MGGGAWAGAKAITPPAAVVGDPKNPKAGGVR